MVDLTGCGEVNTGMIQRFTYTGWKDTIVSGWSSESFDYDQPDLSGNLKWVQVAPVSDDTCSDAFDYPFPDHVICAGELLSALETKIIKYFQGVQKKRVLVCTTTGVPW